MTLGVIELVSYKRELTKEEEDLILIEIDARRNDWIESIRAEEDYGEYPEDDLALEGSFDANIEFETAEAIKSLIKAGKFVLKNENIIILNTEIQSIENIEMESNYI